MPPDPAANFQPTGERFFRTGNGRPASRLDDLAHQAATSAFPGSTETVGGPQTHVLGGAFHCGRARPGQVAAVGHDCPSALFRGVSILNTTQEAGR